ncbi:MAG: sialidase family protein [Betaproteobacteria bacterium]
MTAGISSCLPSLALATAILLAGCGGGSSSSTPTPMPPPAAGPLPDPPVRVSTLSPFAANCDGANVTANLNVNAEVEPSVAVNPRDPNNLVGVWQQDRWGDGSARGIVSGASFDGGATWQQRAMPFSACAGGTFLRVTDPWITMAPDGVAYQNALASSGGSFQPGSRNAVLASRSTDGGRTWSAPATLITDGQAFFNDKNSITADATDARYVYAVWDRLAQDGSGPTYLARSVDRGLTWEPARPIYDAGPFNQTINNQVVVLPNGTLIGFFTQLDAASNPGTPSSVGIVRSTDKGLNWSPRIKIADVGSVGTTAPETGVRVRDGTNLGSIAVSPAGVLHAVWQDARATAGLRDNILLSSSSDGGLTWSGPLRINADPTVAAFTPTVAVRTDGTIGVTYYDFRSNTADPRTLPTDYWLIRSIDGITWRESRVSGPFDLAIAPNANGLFLGDYQSLASIGNVFVPFFAQTSDNDLNNRTDVYAVVARNASVSAAVGVPAKRVVEAARAVTEYRAEAAPPLVVTAELRQALDGNVVQMMERRVPGWSMRRGKGQPPGR